MTIILVCTQLHWLTSPFRFLVDVIRGVNPAIFDDLGMPQRRDPDALPPRNKFEWILNKLYLAVAGLGGGNSLFAVKAGLFTGTGFTYTICYYFDIRIFI